MATCKSPLVMSIWTLAAGRIWRWTVKRDDTQIATGDEFTARQAFECALAARNRASLAAPGLGI